MANPDTGGTRRRLLCSLGASVFGALVLLLLPERAEAANPLHLPLWSVAPFALLLLGIALLPLVARHFWESNRNKGLVSLGLALPTSVLLFVHQWTTGEDTLHPLGHALGDYASFILLVGALYTVSGGILVRDWRDPEHPNELRITVGRADDTDAVLAAMRDIIATAPR